MDDDDVVDKDYRPDCGADSSSEEEEEEEEGGNTTIAKVQYSTYEIFFFLVREADQNMSNCQSRIQIFIKKNLHIFISSFTFPYF